jgi:hypothetical protein
MVRSRLVWLTMFGILIVSGCRSHSEDLLTSKTDANARFPIVKNGKWGYMDRNGSLVIPPQFEKAATFSEGLAPVRVNGKWGYIDVHGMMVIKPQYAAAMQFSEGIGLVSYETWQKNAPVMFYFSSAAGVGRGGNVKDCPTPDDDGFYAYGWDPGIRFAYLDKEGRVILENVFQYACKFHEGLAAVATSRKAEYIDKTGKVVLQTPFEFADSFSEGYARVSYHRGERPGDPEQQFGYIDKSAKIVIEPKFDDVHRFSDGLAAVWPYNVALHNSMNELKERAKNGGQGGIIAGVPVPIQYPDFIDQSGKVVIPKGAYTGGAFKFKDGLAAVGNGFIDRTGKKVIDCGESKLCLQSFSEGLASFSISTGKATRKTGFMNQGGKTIIPPQFDDVDSFQDGLALIRIGGKGTNVDGNWQQFYGARIGYVDKTGKYVWEPTN